MPISVTLAGKSMSQYRQAGMSLSVYDESRGAEKWRSRTGDSAMLRRK